MFEIKYHRKSTENLFRAGFKYRVVSGVMWGFLWELRCEAMQKKNDFFLKIFFKKCSRYQYTPNISDSWDVKIKILIKRFEQHFVLLLCQILKEPSRRDKTIGLRSEGS